MTDSPHVHTRGPRSERGGKPWFECSGVLDDRGILAAECEAWQFWDDAETWRDSPRPERLKAVKREKIKLATNLSTALNLGALYMDADPVTRVAIREALSLPEEQRALAVKVLDLIDENAKED